MPVRFGEFLLDRERRLLLRDGEPLRLAGKAFELLDLLITERPRALSKEQIRDRVWPRTVVSESTLNSLIGELRKALDDPAHDARVIRTIHGFGYGFAAEAFEQASGPEPSKPTPALLTARLLWQDRLIPLLAGENVLGRDDDVTIRIDAPSVSRHHARIRVVTGEPPTIEDLGSKNGTWLAGRRLKVGPAPLSDGDTVRLGRIEVIFLNSREKGSTQTVGDT